MRNYFSFTGFVLFGLLVACGDKSTEQRPSEKITTSLEMVYIPPGKFIMGSDKTDTEGKSKEYGFIQPLYVDEHPQRRVELKGFWIDKFEVSNAKFLLFYRETHGNVTDQIISEQQQAIADWSNLPVSQVTWYQAQGYCLWAGKRLPTEMEWEKAARGPEGLEFPWGHDWDAARLNNGVGNRDAGVAKVGSYPGGVSFYGVHDMAGNVAEWVADWYQMYDGGDYKSQFAGSSHKVVRGGGWGGVGHYVMPVLFRSSHRDYEKPDRIFNDIGFRCAKDAD